MSYIPAFELGFWNAWIFIVPIVFYWFAGIKFVFAKRMPDSPSLKRKRDRFLSNFLVVVMFASFFYSVFVPFKLGSIWFYIGLIVYLAGSLLLITAFINFATNPINKPVTKGVYRFSRNPMFLAFFLIYFAIAIACISWVYFVITILFILIMLHLSPFEEAITLGHYGKEYKEYMKRTPKWIGFPKI